MRRYITFRHWKIVLAITLTAMAWCGPGNATTHTYTLKFATLAPPGSTWMNLLEDWKKEVAARSENRLVLKIYPGGVQGDEPDVLKKIRFDQLQGGAFTGYGIGKMYSPARVMELPFLFEDHAEIDHVRRALTPDIERGFREHGYRFLGWMELGYIYFFSQHPIRNLDDLKPRRIWLWQGDELGEAIFQSRDLSPVPLSVTDVFTSLSTGLIDTVYCTPLSAVALQWFTKVKYATEVPMLNGIGGLVVSDRFFEKLPPDLQAILTETGRETGEKLVAATRVDNANSVSVLKKEGIEFLMPDNAVDKTERARMLEQSAAEMAASGYIPATVYRQTVELLRKFRSQRAAVTAGGG